VPGLVPFAQGLGQRGHRTRAPARIHAGEILQRQQVRIRESSGSPARLPSSASSASRRGRVEEARLLHHLAAVLDQLDLAAHLVLDRLLEEAERVEVLDLAARAERLAGLRTETFASQRNEPSCMLPSQMPIQRTSACSAFA
jgi:hypothetical protein